MVEGLGSELIEALAGLVTVPAEACQLVVEAGVPAAALPWNSCNPREFWVAVSAELASGVTAHGRDRLLEVLRSRFPHHPIFGSPAPARLLSAGKRVGRPIREVVDPFALEVHPAIDAGAAAGLSPLPTYVAREHDLRLRSVVARAVEGASAIAVLVGGSSTGKSRACWEAVQALPEDWCLWHPINPGRPEAALEELTRIGPRTVVWLNETHRYLLTKPTDLGDRVAAGLRDLLRDPDRRPILVLGTVWPEYWAVLSTVPRPCRPDPHAQARALITNDVISLPYAFTGGAREALRVAAMGDPRLAEAEARALDGEITQYLAGGPELLARYDNAPPAARAVIEAAMDARLLGHSSSLPRGLLEDAAPGYLTDQQWDALADDWLDQALTYTGEPCRGAPGPVRRIRPRPGQIISPEPFYWLAEYLEHHARGTLRGRRAPASLWDALVAHATSTDAAALAAYAHGRLLDRYAIALFRRAADGGNGNAAGLLAGLLAGRHDLDGLRARACVGDRLAAERLAELLIEGGDYGEAEQLLRSLAVTGEPSATARLADLLAMRGDVQELWARADAGDPIAGIRLVDLLAQRGDLDGLRVRADSSDLAAAVQLARLLVQRGDVDGLRARADSQWGAAVELARLLAERGDLDELQARVDAGDCASAVRLARLFDERGQYDRAEQILRILADAGDDYAGLELVQLRAERGDLGSLRALAADGFESAADALACWVTKAGDYQEIGRVLRAFEEAGDWEIADGLARLLAKNGDLDSLQGLTEVGDMFAAEQLADLLVARGEFQEAEQILRNLADAGHDLAAILLIYVRAEGGDLDELQDLAEEDEAAACELARLLAGRGEYGRAERILHAVANAGFRFAGDELASLLTRRGRTRDAERLRRFGLNPDGSIASGPDG
ncbi:effector-associated domain EAD1-containing protein [Pseudofrankia asymbiotica]|uniref:Effector-associated domain-containing protein n=1 Tax=Pseudofrankia asymbiotica TaxID=1834516 RepID=A0A1V2I497_9ACTN|nr:effector-associated domain EAD1-containing protein [Pseudofrankia asymbiotica]ONH25519.1 hypothetical protein BL253_27315 [Pseudofrankia asymbiotica]